MIVIDHISISLINKNNKYSNYEWFMTKISYSVNGDGFGHATA